MRNIRFRYVVFKILGERVTRGDIIKWLNGLSRREGFEENDRLRLVYFEENVGLVRCTHRLKERVIGLINGTVSIGHRNFEVKTIGTSGTIKAALSKFVKT